MYAVIQLSDASPLKDKVSFFENYVECYLQEAVVQAVVEVVSLENIALGAGPCSRVLCQVKVNKPYFTKVLAALLLFPD